MDALFNRLESKVRIYIEFLKYYALGIIGMVPVGASYGIWTEVVIGYRYDPSPFVYAGSGIAAIVSWAILSSGRLSIDAVITLLIWSVVLGTIASPFYFIDTVLGQVVGSSALPIVFLYFYVKRVESGA